VGNQQVKYTLKVRIQRAILKFRMRVSEFIAYIAYYLLPAPRKPHLKVVIFGQGRTGSTLLESLLTSNNLLKPRGEILSNVMIEVLWPLKFVEGRYKLENSNFIFHLKFYQLTYKRKKQLNPTKVIHRLYQNGWKIIYLRRENKVMHAISNIVAQNRGAYHKHDSSQEQLRFNVDLPKLEQYVKNRTLNAEIEPEMVKGLDFVEVIYERDLENASNHQQTADRVFEFLGLPSSPVKTSHKKVNSKNLRDIFLNYDEFLACAEKNGWTYYLPKEDQKPN